MKRPFLRRTIIFTIFLIAIFGFLYLARTTRSLSKMVRDYVEVKLSEAFDREVNIGKVSTNIVNRITLQNVAVASGRKLSEGTVLLLEKVTIKYNPLLILLAKRDPGGSVVKVILKSPHLFLTNRRGKWDFPLPVAFRGKAIFPTFPDIAILNGKVTVEDVSGKLRSIEIREVSGFLSLRGGVPRSLWREKRGREERLSPEFYFSFSGKSNQSTDDRIRLKGTYLKEKRSLRLSLNILDLDLPSYSRIFLPNTKFKVLKGEADLDLNLNTILNEENYEKIVTLATAIVEDKKRYGDFAQILSFSGELAFGKLFCQWSSHSLNGVKGKIVFDNHRIGTPGIFLQYRGVEIKVSGGVEQYLSQPVLGLTLSANLGLSRLPEIVRVDAWNRILPLDGSAKLSADISGTLSNPKCKGWLLIPEGKVSGRPFEEFQGQFVYEDRVLRIINLQGKVYEGTLVFSGEVDISRPYVNLDFVLRSIDLAKLTPREWIDRVGGKGSLSGNIFGQPSDLEAKGEIGLREFRLWGRHFGSVSGFFHYAKRGLEIEANSDVDGYKLSTGLLFEGDGMRVSRLEILLPERARIALFGRVGFSTGGKLELSISNSYIHTAKLPWIGQRTDIFSGRVDFLGEIRGTIRSPDVSGKAWSSGLRVMDEEVEFNCGFHYRDRILRVTPFELNRAYYADLTFNLERKKPAVTGFVETTEGDLKFISSLFSGNRAKSKEMAGTVRGRVDFSNFSLGASWCEELKAKGAFSIFQPRLGWVFFDELVLEFNMAQQELNLNRFGFSVGFGEITGSAKIGMEKDSENIIDISTRFQNYPIISSFRKQPDEGGDLKQIRPAVAEGTGRNSVDGRLNFHGKLVWKKDWKIAGSFLGEELKYNGEKLGAVGAKLALNRKLAYLSSLYCGNDLKGDITIDLAKGKTISGSIEVNKSPVPHFLRLVIGRGADRLAVNQIKGNLNGKLLFSGLLENPRVTGYLDIERGTFSGTDFMFKSTFNYERTGMNLESAELKFVSGGRIIAKGGIDPNKPEPVEGILTVEELELSELTSLFQQKKSEILGKVNGNIQVRGAFNHPRLKAALQLKDIRISSFQADKIETAFRAERVIGEENASAELVFDSFSAGFGEGLVRLVPEGRIGLSLSRKLIDFSLFGEFRNINLAKLSIFGGAELDGTVDFSGNSPVLETRLTTRDLWVNQHNFEAVSLRLSYADSKLFFLPVAKESFQLLGEIDFESPDRFKVKLIEFFRGKDRLITASGNVNLSGPISVTVEGRKSKIPASVLAELLNLTIPVKGDSGFVLKLSRTMAGQEKERLLESLRIEGKIEVANGSIGNLPFSDFHALFQADGSTINVEELILAKKGEYDVKCWGRIPYPKDSREIDFSLQMSDSKGSVLCLLTRGISDARGELESSLRITGRREEPVINGYFRVRKATLYFREVLKRIDDLTCDISVKDSNIVINWIKGKIERGEMDFKGVITLAGWIPDKFDVTFENAGYYGIPLRIPFLKIPQSSFFGRLLSEVPCSLELKGRIHAYGSPRSYFLEGVIELENTHFTYPPRPQDTKDLNLDFLKPAVWNLEVRAGKNTWYENRFAEVQVEGYMRLTRPTNDLTVNGALSAVKGEISYLGATFSVKEANVECINDELFLEVRAECPVEDDTIVLVVERGKWGKVKPQFVSRNDPQMSQQEALVKATGLDSLKLSSQEGDVLLRKELLKLIDSSLASPLIKSILRSTGIVDVVKIDTAIAQKTGERLSSVKPAEQGERSSLLEGTKITLGKYLSNSLYLGYKLQFEEGYLNRLELRHEVELLYRIKRGISLRGKLGEEERYFGVERQIRF